MLRGTLRLLTLLGLAFPAAGQIFVPGDHPTLAEAIAAASPGDVILLSGSTGPVVIDKPLTIVGNPRFKLQISCAFPHTYPGLPGSDGFHLQGPGAGRVVLANFTTEGAHCAEFGSAITGSGFDELHVLNADIELTKVYLLDGIAKGNDAIDVDVPVLLISASSIRGGGSDVPTDQCTQSVWQVLAAGVHAPNSQVILLDSTVKGGETSQICCAPCDCPPLPDASLGGTGGPGVVADSLFVSNSDVEGGAGAPYLAYIWGSFLNPWGTPLECGKQADGADFIANTHHALFDTLSGPPTAKLGQAYDLTTSLWGYSSGLAWLYASLGASTPLLSAHGWIFLDPATTVFLGSAPVAPYGAPQVIPLPIPPDHSLLGVELAFQAIDGSAGLTRPVFAVVAP